MEQPNPSVQTPQAPAPEPQVPSGSVTLSTADLQLILKTAVQEALGPMAQTVEELRQANARLQEQVSKASATGFAENVPAHLRAGSADPLVDGSRSSIAMSVTIATRPVVENPDQYTHVVDAGGLVQNTLPQLIDDISKPLKDDPWASST